MSAENPPAPQYKPGDVVNGHVLTHQGQWVPNGQPFSAVGGRPGPVQDGMPTSVPPRAWYKKKRVLIPGVIAVLAIGGALGGGNDATDTGPTALQSQRAQPTEEETPSAEEAAEATAKAAADAEADRVAEEARIAEEAAAAAATAAEEAAAVEAAAAEEAARGTLSQQNAFDQASDYLSFMAFSRSGLIGQLEFEGYPSSDAEFAVARVEASGGVDWNVQAAAKAASYLELTSFSRSGLIDQLEFEGFTPEQAAHGAASTGL